MARARTNPRSRGRRRGGFSADVKWTRHLEVDTKRGMRRVADMVAEGIEDKGEQGRRGSNSRMPPLDPAYAAKKAREGGAPVPDLRRSGDLWASFGVIKVTAKDAWVGFRLAGADAIKKFRALAKASRSPLKLGKTQVRQLAEELVRRGILRSVPGPLLKGRRRSR